MPGQAEMSLYGVHSQSSTGNQRAMYNTPCSETYLKKQELLRRDSMCRGHILPG